MTLKKYSRSLDLLLAATDAYRRGDLPMSGRMFVRAMSDVGIKETIAALDNMNEQLLVKSPMMAKAIAAARKELAKVKGSKKRAVEKADGEELPQGGGQFGEGLEETVEGEDTVDPGQGMDFTEEDGGEEPTMDEDIEALLDDTGDEDDVEEESADDGDGDTDDVADETEEADPADGDGDNDEDDAVEDEATVVASKKKVKAKVKAKAEAAAKAKAKAEAAAKAIAKAKAASVKAKAEASKKQTRSNVRIARTAKNLKALARLSKGK